MVLEQQVPVVLMLTNCNEAGVVKCSQYFPNTLHSVSKAGSYEVKVSRKTTNAVG
jgi:protein tyrosine phosphatase